MHGHLRRRVFGPAFRGFITRVARNAVTALVIAGTSLRGFFATALTVTRRLRAGAALPLSSGWSLSSVRSCSTPLTLPRSFLSCRPLTAIGRITPMCSALGPIRRFRFVRGTRPARLEAFDHLAFQTALEQPLDAAHEALVLAR
jgi:hypothetical protein